MCMAQESPSGFDSDIEQENDAAAARTNSHQEASTRQGNPKDEHKQQITKKKKNKLSTGVNLLDPKAAAHGEVGGGGNAAASNPTQPSAELSPFHALIQTFMTSQGHSEPTPVQQQCWLPACAGRDVQGVAEPGSGKTLAYVLPGFARLKVPQDCVMNIWSTMFSVAEYPRY